MGENRAREVYIAVCICYPLAFVGVMFRFYVRYFMQKIMGFDDWLMVLSLVGHLFILSKLHSIMVIMKVCKCDAEKYIR